MRYLLVVGVSGVDIATLSAVKKVLDSSKGVSVHPIGDMRGEDMEVYAKLTACHTALNARSRKRAQMSIFDSELK